MEYGGWEDSNLSRPFSARKTDLSQPGHTAPTVAMRNLWVLASIPGDQKSNTVNSKPLQSLLQYVWSCPAFNSSLSLPRSPGNKGALGDSQGS